MATATRTIERKSGTKVIVTMTRDVVDEIAYADGYNIPVGRQIISRTEIKLVTPDGKAKYGDSVTICDPKYYAKEIAKGGYAMLVHDVYMSKDLYEQVVAALAEVDAEIGKSDEYIAIEQAAAAKTQRIIEASKTADPHSKQSGWCSRCHDWTYGDCGHTTTR